MRKLWIVAAAVASLFFAGCGGSDKYYTTNTTTTSTATNGIPNNVIRSFYNMYPSAQEVEWKVQDGLYKADFEIGGNDMNASFTPDGNFVKSNG